MLLRRILCVIISSVVIPATLASTEHTSKYWTELNVQGNLKLHEKLLYSLQSQARFDGHKNQFQLGLISAGIGYRLNANMNFRVGYQWESVDMLSHTPQEHSFWQQMTVDGKASEDLTYTSRTRLEQRTLADQPEWAYRLREKLILKLPKKIGNHLTPFAYDEIFVNLNTALWIENLVVDQNRFFVGLDVPITKKNYLEFGYLNQASFYEKRDMKVNHIAVVSLQVAI